MKLRTLLPLFVLLSAVAFAADFAGTWKGEAHSAEGGAFPLSVTLKTDGGALSGTLTQGKGTAKEIEDAKLDGEQFTFVLRYKGPNGDVRMTSYTGKMEGNQLKLTSQREGSARKQDSLLDRQ